MYGVWVTALKRPAVVRLWRRWKRWRGALTGDYGRLPEYIRNYAPGKRFVDVGCMWGVNGRYAFLAEEAGATAVVGIDVFGPTPEFEADRAERGSRVEFVLGDATSADTVARVGTAEVVFCAGVLYHHPSPFDLLVALRQMCSETLILRTSSVPELPWLRNAAVYFPMLDRPQRRLWELGRLGVSHQVGISGEGFDPAAGYGNWFWGLTPSCLTSLLRTAGFEVDWRFEEPFAQTLICHVVDPPFDHRLPDASEARAIGEAVSASGRAAPA
jgi:SAM-dependent methyltransferase